MSAPRASLGPWFSTPGWTRVKGAILMLAAVLLGVSLATSDHGHTLVAGLLAMGAATAMFVAGVLVGHDIGQRYESENSQSVPE